MRTLVISVITIFALSAATASAFAGGGGPEGGSVLNKTFYAAQHHTSQHTAQKKGKER